MNARRDGENITPYRAMNRAFVGDVVSFQCHGVDQLHENFSTLFGFGNRREYDSDNNVIGKITAIGVASRAISSSSADINDRNMNCEGNMQVIEKLSLMLSDRSHIATSGNIPINGKRQLFGAGDILAIIRSIHHDDADNCIVLVNRFNVPPGEYDEQMFSLQWKINEVTDNETLQYSQISFIDKTIDLEGTTVLDIHQTSIIQISHDGRMSDKQTSSTGVLADGRKYFIYRFVLFWDGFQVSEGGSKSVEGIYLVPLNLPSKYRSNSSAVRVLSLLPKPIPTSVVLDEILADIKLGMVEGITDYDANGEEITIFLDMVGCIGDTPAINEMLDIRGHTAIACCHLCRFRRLGLQVDLVLGQNDENLFKPRYMGTDVHGGKAFASRSLVAHSALEAFQLDEGTKKRLGIQMIQNLPFYRYQKEFNQIAEKIPRTKEGTVEH